MKFWDIHPVEGCNHRQGKTKFQQHRALQTHMATHLLPRAPLGALIICKDCNWLWKKQPVEAVRLHKFGLL